MGKAGKVGKPKKTTVAEKPISNSEEPAKNINRYEGDISKLSDKGNLLLISMVVKEEPEKYKDLIKKAKDISLPDIRSDYQAWYSESLALIRQLLPDRFSDFVACYKSSTVRKEIIFSNYTMSDYVKGVTVTRGYNSEKVVGPDAAIPVLQQQVMIVEACKERLKSSLFDIRAVVQAELFDDELDASEELSKKGFHRGAGAIAGVVLEGHLETICNQHSLTTSKNPTIAELNDVLKRADIIDMPTWRFIQHLGDLRNLCDHKKQSDPTKENVADLIQGVRKIIKTVF